MRSFVLVLVLAAAAISRVLIAQWAPELASFSIVGALALVAGAYGGLRWTSFAFTFTFLFLSDLVINAWVYEGKYGLIHSGFYWPYLIFAGIIYLGYRLSPGTRVGRWVIGSIVATILHAGILDGLYWAMGGTDILTGLPLPKTAQGLMQAYVQGLPFAKNFFAGTLFYSLILMICLEFSPSLFQRFTKATERISQ